MAPAIAPTIIGMLMPVPFVCACVLWVVVFKATVVVVGVDVVIVATVVISGCVVVGSVVVVVVVLKKAMCVSRYFHNLVTISCALSSISRRYDYKELKRTWLSSW